MSKLYDVCIMRKNHVTNTIEHVSTPHYNKPYPLANYLAKQENLKSPVNVFVIPVPNGVNPLTHLREKELKKSTMAVKRSSNRSK